MTGAEDSLTLERATEHVAVLGAVVRSPWSADLERSPFTVTDVERWSGRPTRLAWAVTGYLLELGVVAPLASRPDHYAVTERYHALARRLRRWDGLGQVLEGADPDQDVSTSGGASTHYPTELARMRELGARAVPRLLELLELPRGARLRILEPGGGAATWSGPLVEHLPGSSSVVLDLPAVVEAARDQVPAPVTLVGADMFGAPWTEHTARGPVDVVVLGNVLHLFGPARCRELLARARDVVADDGRVLVIDVLRDHARGLWASRYGLSLALRTGDGGVWSSGEVATWAADAGLVVVRPARPLADSPPLSLLELAPAPDGGPS